MTEAETKRRYEMRQRAEAVEATKRAILDAVLEIGDPRVGLAEIAERAGVSERTLLRHFGSRDGLTAEAIRVADARIRAERFAIEPGDVDAAARNLVAHYETYGDRVIARLAEEGRDPRIDQLLETGRRVHRDWVREKLGPLLGELPRRTRRRRIAQLVAVCDVYTWKLLRRDMGLGVEESEKAVAELIRGVVEGGTER